MSQSTLHHIVPSTIPELSRGRIDQTEDIVENEVASLAVGKKLERLGVAHGLPLLVDLDDKHISTHTQTPTSQSSTYQQSASNHDENTAMITRRLRIKRRDLMLDFLEGKRLQPNISPSAI